MIVFNLNIFYSKFIKFHNKNLKKKIKFNKNATTLNNIYIHMIHFKLYKKTKYYIKKYLIC
jgi:hypothetical protein